MNLAEWIIVMFLAVALLVFLIVGIIFIVKFTSLLSEIEIINKDESYNKYLENFTKRLKEKYNKKVNIPKKEKNTDRGIER